MCKMLQEILIPPLVPTLKVWMNPPLHLTPAAGTCVSSDPLAPWILQMLSCFGNTCVTLLAQKPPALMSNLASEIVTALLKCSHEGVEGEVRFPHCWRPYWQMLILNDGHHRFSALLIPLFTREGGRTVNLSPHSRRLGRWTTGKLYDRCSLSPNSCLFRAKPWSARGIAFNQELAPLFLNWLTSRSISGKRVESLLSIFSLSCALLS